jgi:large subunit ribosomal protein L32e
VSERKVPLSKKALKTRERAKNKKPSFVRSESWRYDKFSDSWRRPRGLDHKMRRKIKGWPPTVSVGYKGPKIARGLHPSGYREVIVHNINDIAPIDPATQAARIAHTVGMRKRAQIIAEAKKRKVYILNFKVIKESPKEETDTEQAEAEQSKLKKKPVKKEDKPKRTPKKTKTEKGAEK